MQRDTEGSLTRRHMLNALGAGAAAMISMPVWAQETFDFKIAGGPSVRPVTTSFPQKGRMILQRTSPPWLETPFDTFDKGYSNGWDLKSAMHPQTILAYAWNDRPLTAAHGAPLRLYSPIKLGYKLTKYLSAVTFTAEQPGGYWENQGYPWLGGI